MRGISQEQLAARKKIAEDIANGNGPLDKVERFCRERKICYYHDFIGSVWDEDPELAEWVSKSGRGVAARTRGINARIAKVRRDIEKADGNT